MIWTALIPMERTPGARSRRSRYPPDDARLTRGGWPGRAVIAALQEATCIGTILVLSDVEPLLSGIRWERDRGLGLNAELVRFRQRLIAEPFLVIRGDLPHALASDIHVLCLAALGLGASFAANRRDMDTNAVALSSGRSLDFRFGAGLFAHHVGAAHAIVTSRGLAAGLFMPVPIMASLSGRQAPLR